MACSTHNTLQTASDLIWPSSRDACSKGHRPEGGSIERFSGQVDLVVAAVSAEAGTDGGQELFEDSALYDVD